MNIKTPQHNGNCATCNTSLYRKPSHWNAGLKAYCNKACRAGTSSINEVGKKYNMLTIIEFAGKDKFNYSLWKCQCDCGNFKIVTRRRLVTGTTKSCGCIRKSGFKNFKWKTGKTKNPGGYIIIRDEITGKVKGLEHRVVLEEYLGRKLTAEESVHHKNGIRDDNRLENLELRARYHGMGQTIPDLIAWAKEILLKYDKESE